MRDKGSTEIAGYGVSLPDDPLAVVDFVTVKQEATSATFELDPEDLSRFFNEMCDLGMQPWQHQRILLHTHPGNSANPSGTDEKNFDEVWCKSDWAIMFILARGGHTTCRIRFRTTHGIALDHEIPVKIDYTIPFIASNEEAWEKEYKENIQEITYSYQSYGSPAAGGQDWRNWYGHMPSSGNQRSFHKDGYEHGRYTGKDGSEYVWDEKAKTWRYVPADKKQSTQPTQTPPKQEPKEDRLPTENRVPLWYYMKDMSIDEMIGLLADFKIESDHVEDYFIYEENGVLWAEEWENNQIPEEWIEAEKEVYNTWMDDWFFLQQREEYNEAFTWEEEEEKNTGGFLKEEPPATAPPKELTPGNPSQEEPKK